MRAMDGKTTEIVQTDEPTTKTLRPLLLLLLLGRDFALKYGGFLELTPLHR
jgi:hypothetical protein